MPKPSEKYFSEFLGTFALVFVGAGAVVVDAHTGGSHALAETGKLGVVGVALAHGLTLTAMIYGVGSISGGHFNPAISLAAWVRRRLDAELVVGYLLAQFSGAVVAALLLASIFPDEVALAQIGTPALGQRISLLQGFAVEAAITFLLTVVVLAATRPDNRAAHPFAGLAIGATLIGLVVFAYPLTGAAANPARYLGPALVSRSIDELWIYLMAPLFGGAFAAFVVGFGVETRRAVLEAAGVEAEELEAEPTEAGARARPGRRRRRAPAAARRAGRGAYRHDAREAEESAWGHGEDEAGPKTAPKRSPWQDRTQQALRKAQELYWGGDGEKAAAALVPLLARAAREGRVINERVRSLLIVIEDTHGRLDMLDRYRHILDRPEAQQAH